MNTCYKFRMLRSKIYEIPKFITSHRSTSPQKMAYLDNLYVQSTEENLFTNSADLRNAVGFTWCSLK